MNQEQKEAPVVTRTELAEIFGGSENAIRTMEKVFADHRVVETVIVNPDSWVGKELLDQSRRLIELRHDMNRLERKIDQLAKLFQEALPLQEQKEPPAVTGEELERIRSMIDDGRLTINQARKRVGLEPIDRCTFDQFLTRDFLTIKGTGREANSKPEA